MGPGTTHALLPNIQITDFLFLENVKNNTVVLFGAASKLIEKAEGYYKDISASILPGTIGDNNVLDF